VSCVLCLVSCVLCLVSCVLCLVSCVLCLVSCVLTLVSCPLSHVDFLSGVFAILSSLALTVTECRFSAEKRLKLPGGREFRTFDIRR
jgi:hypothetical protein